MPRADSSSNLSKAPSAKNQQDAVGIENYELPKSLITKIAKSAIPENTKLQKEVVTSLVKGSTVFINYLGASAAHDVAASKQHKSISATDVLKALELLEFADMVPGLQTELQAYRDTQKKGKQSGASKGKAKETDSPAKAKGKEKAAAVPSAVSQTDQEPQDVDEDESGNTVRVRPEEDEDMLDPEEEGDIPEEEIPEDEPEEEDEELVDNVAVEEEELQRDARGLEDTGGVETED
ncbi:histone-fold-containing protein [Gloeophyllum trabeum ATCC 11539]|uniref:DNA polymerase epsilon subunit D n=1 Tax=Gloeophyllum trabeum (strain ATCC 11539 / FP-39264 / Madison 617) TaxID=670483 RepID=S7Q026_GLOTA|nr:histone-fold-containing protein [Gloeophyllum trabeum ATCC 11539]EPQ53038.1 histone-fold-containing protein [Gloeophyllum trabeum ATCC 11539]